MKKFITCSLCVLALLASLALTACTEEVSESDSTASQDSGTVSATGYYFTYNDTDIILGAAADAIIESLGEYKSYFESESCAFEGLDKVYSYSGFKVNTYEEDGVDYILSVVFSNDTVENAEGITIGSSKDAVLAAYGDPTSETTSSLVYEKDGTQLVVGISNDSVASLQYLLITE